jgi:hypothetical protein
MEAPAASSEMGAACLPVARLPSPQDGSDASEVGRTAFEIKGKRRDQRIGGVADLAERDRPVFPPAAARSGVPRTND